VKAKIADTNVANVTNVASVASVARVRGGPVEDSTVMYDLDKYNTVGRHVKQLKDNTF
jgi:hypothetical protein